MGKLEFYNTWLGPMQKDTRETCIRKILSIGDSINSQYNSIQYSSLINLLTIKKGRSNNYVRKKQQLR